MYQLFDSDTICAVSTPPGVGGIAVVRVSGPDAVSIIDSVWRGKPLADAITHTVHLGDIIDPDNPSEPLDTAVATLFRNPRSFTGEDVVEISVHGSRWIQRELVNLLIRRGCRMAQPGEFTRRAFANGRLDLAQAEAVADVIASSSRSAHRLAASQMRGDFSKYISGLRDSLIEIASLLELELDFSEEDVEFASRAHLRELAATLLTRISSLAASFSTGTALKDGVAVAIVGEPNAGKSTLLNALLHDDRAIVSNIPGTTRDTIEDTIEIDGVLYRFIDTAGIRETSDSVENLGIGRSYDAISRARIVVWLITPDLSPIDYASLRDTIKQHLSPETALITVLNKIDLLPEGCSMSENSTIINSDLMTVNDFADESGSDAKNYFVSREDSVTRGDVVSDGSSMFKDNIIKETIDNEGIFLQISAATGENIPALLSMLKDLSGANSVEEADLIVTNARHYESLVHAKSSLERVIDGIDSNLSGDFIAQDLRETIHHLSTITGTITTTDLLKTIFERFCIGK